MKHKTKIRGCFQLWIGLVLIAAGLLWHFVLAQRWIRRIPPGWSWTANFVGDNAYADPITQVYSKPVATPYRRNVRVISATEHPRAALVEDQYVAFDPMSTTKKVWEHVVRATVDPQTGARLEPAYAGQYFVLPRHTQKESYVLRANYLKGIPIRFQREEQVAGLSTYVFAYNGRIEYTESYEGTADSPGVTVEPGQEIRCENDQFSFQEWVEPVTGEVVKVRESCYSGDAIFQTTSGKKVSSLSRWGGETAGDDVLERVQQIRRTKLRSLVIEQYIPDFMLLLGIGCCTTGLAGARRQRACSSSVSEQVAP